jgi:predicted DNA binding CopG/RHH family protein
MSKPIDETKIDPFDDTEEEKEVVDAFEKGLLEPVENQEMRREQLRQYAKATISKTKHISIRVSEKDLRKIKAKAVETGIPYQTLIGSLLHQYASGRITLTL